MQRYLASDPYLEAKVQQVPVCEGFATVATLAAVDEQAGSQDRASMVRPALWLVGNDGLLAQGQPRVEVWMRLPVDCSALTDPLLDDTLLFGHGVKSSRRGRLTSTLLVLVLQYLGLQTEFGPLELAVPASLDVEADGVLEAGSLLQFLLVGATAAEDDEVALEDASRVAETSPEVTRLRILLEHAPDQLDSVEAADVIEDGGCSATVGDKAVAHSDDPHIHSAAWFVPSRCLLSADQRALEMIVGVLERVVDVLRSRQFHLGRRGRVTSSQLFIDDLLGRLCELASSELLQLQVVGVKRTLIHPTGVSPRQDVPDFADSFILVQLIDEVALHVPREDGRGVVTHYDLVSGLDLPRGDGPAELHIGVADLEGAVGASQHSPVEWGYRLAEGYLRWILGLLETRRGRLRRFSILRINLAPLLPLWCALEASQIARFLIHRDPGRDELRLAAKLVEEDLIAIGVYLEVKFVVSAVFRARLRLEEVFVVALSQELIVSRRR